jgi:hypothetical protein
LATAAQVVWVIDTSSICEVRRLPNANKPQIFSALGALVAVGRLVYPPEVVAELERQADPENPDPQYAWANSNAAAATPRATCSFDEMRAVLAIVPDVLDASKDSGAEEADPYVLAAARKLREAGIDARIVTQESKDTPAKMSLNTAAGILGIPSVPLRGLLAAEGIG